MLHSGEVPAGSSPLVRPSLVPYLGRAEVIEESAHLHSLPIQYLS